MTPNDLLNDARQAKLMGTNMTLVVPRPWKDRPQGFPWGELLCEQPGQAVRSFDPDKIIDFILESGLGELE